MFGSFLSWIQEKDKPVFVDALYDALLEDGREPTDGDLINAMARMVPLACLMDGQIAALKNWAKGRARTAVADQSTQKKATRRLAVLN